MLKKKINKIIILCKITFLGQNLKKFNSINLSNTFFVKNKFFNKTLIFLAISIRPIYFFIGKSFTCKS